MKVIDIEDIPKRKKRAPKYLKNMEQAISLHQTGKAVVLDMPLTGAKSALNYIAESQDHKLADDARALKLSSRGGMLLLLEA